MEDEVDRRLDKVAVAKARWFGQRYKHEVKDLRQEAWVAICLAKRSYQPAKGSLVQYARVGVHRWLTGYVIKCASPITASRHTAVYGVGSVPMPTDGGPTQPRATEAPWDGFDRGLVRAKTLNSCSALCRTLVGGSDRQSVTDGLARIVLGMSRTQDELVNTGLTAAQLYRLAAKVRRELAGSREMWTIWREWQ